MDDLYLRIMTAAHMGAHGHNSIPTPSQAQHDAGNYRVGKVMLHGLPISIEQPRNSFREGVDPNGVAWRCRMAADYGYIRGYKGADGDSIDVFIGLVPERTTAYVINQVAPDTSAFDEHKVMLGFMDEADARRAYLESYSRGWKGLGSIVPCTITQLKWWLRNGDLTRPISAKSIPYDGNAEMNTWDKDANPVGTDMAGVLYGLRADDADNLLLDAVTVADVIEDADAVLEFDALVTPYSQIERKMTVLQTVMEAAGQAVKPVAMQITDPFKQLGTTHVAAVFELSDGQSISIFFHNPDTTPAKIKPTDDLISWKWMLNKKDITLLVAPENGADLNVREVARRIMKVAEKNSDKFQKANKNRAERLAGIETLKTTVQAKESELEALTAEETALQGQLAAKQAEPQPAPEPTETGLSGNIRDPFKVNIFNPYENGDIVKLGGEKWQVRNETSGWYLTNTGNWRGTHSTIKGVRSMGDLIALIEKEAAKQAEPQPDTQPSPAAAAINIDAIKAVMTDVQPMQDVPADWIIMNAPRPLVGDKTLEGGEFLDGRFYAAIDPASSTTALFVDSNVKNAAVVVMVVPKEKQAAMAMSGSKYLDKYIAMPADQRARAVQPLINKLQGRTYGELRALLAAAAALPPAADPVMAVDDADRQFVEDSAAGTVDFMDTVNIDRLEAINGKYPNGELADQLSAAKTAAMNAVVNAFKQRAG